MRGKAMRKMFGLIAALTLAGCLSTAVKQDPPANPQTAADYTAQGRQLALKKETQGRAIESFKRAQELATSDDERAEALKGLGEIYFIIARDNDALKCYSDALRLRPGDPGARTMLGATLTSIENYNAALKELNAVIEKNPSYPDAYAWRGLVHHRRKLWGKAILDFQQALLMELPKPLRIRTCADLADAYVKTGQYQQALDTWQEMIRLEPRMNTPEVRRYMELARTAQKAQNGS